MTMLQISRTVLRPILVRWWQPGRIARLDCTGLVTVTVETSLPYVPQFQALNLIVGEFQMMPPTPQQAALLRAGKSYGLHVVLRNVAGAGQDEYRLTVEAI